MLKGDKIYDGSQRKLAELIQHMVYVVQKRFNNYNQIETILRDSMTRSKQTELDMVIPSDTRRNNK